MSPVAMAVIYTGPSCQPLVAAEDEEFGPDDSVLQPRLNNSAMLGNLDTLIGHLPVSQANELEVLILTFSLLFSDTLVRLTPRAQEVSAFITPSGLYCTRTRS